MADKKDKPDKAEQAAKAEQTAKAERRGKGQARRQGASGAAEAGRRAAKAAARAAASPSPSCRRGCALRFEQEIAPALMRELKIENKMRVPRLAEDRRSTWRCSEARDNVKILDAAARRAEGDRRAEAGA